MADFDDLMKALGIPSHDNADVGSFFMGLDGVWRHTCKVDFPFQSDVELVFDLATKSEHLPATMASNVTWIQENLVEIWNAAAVAINEITTQQKIEMEDDFHLEPLFINLPDAPVSSAPWNLLIEPAGLDGSFAVSFQGLAVTDCRLERG